MGALVVKSTNDPRRVAEYPLESQGRLVGSDILHTWTVRLRLRELNGRSRGWTPTLHCVNQFGKHCEIWPYPHVLHGLAPCTLP